MSLKSEILLSNLKEELGEEPYLDLMLYLALKSKKEVVKERARLTSLFGEDTAELLINKFMGGLNDKGFTCTEQNTRSR
jgi:hypothetical protein